ncbi:MAG: ATP synthase F1 subunit delta [Candidatus Marinimicrobia bacterium]|jgi:F-type H+-transporting ATPase subunit delta|nr:ATP synthase F1 subunit delta [Candidatus Neomarinimicrobiota bacterium]MBT3937991.1 ATP synthase F1 subunit delta [Candidatus Neomarinimicrobiota bacterium]MBT3961597.1 ATP synthase F1 subunit delta [Candidatus Neomarinimicrobiota bacterium]MBT4382015.1 ATP synthase F1 subunit delta [Candidatus Neomarinimicrobiota bacterium]MBT4636130.1 ATP synthase F1 subunit delta [Candidatus Neomarinimicrobiota bacterium]
MKHNLKPNQYATALIEVAEQLGATQEVGASFHVVENLIRTNAQFRSFILSKRIPSDQKKQSLVAILGESCHLIVIEFLGMISGAQTIKLIRETGEMIQEKVKDSLNKISVTAHVAEALSESETDHLKLSLDTILEKSTDLNVSVDPELVGGIKLRIENIFLDASIQNKLNELRSDLMQS